MTNTSFILPCNEYCCFTIDNVIVFKILILSCFLKIHCLTQNKLHFLSFFQLMVQYIKVILPVRLVPCLQRIPHRTAKYRPIFYKHRSSLTLCSQTIEFTIPFNCSIHVFTVEKGTVSTTSFVIILTQLYIFFRVFWFYI